MAKKLMTQREYGEYRKLRGMPGTSQSAVSIAIKRGRISTIGGRIDPDIADAEWDRTLQHHINLHSTAPAPKSRRETQSPDDADDPITWQNARLRKEAALAELAEIKLAEKQRALIDRGGHERAAHHAARLIRDGLVNMLPTKIATELAAMTDPWAIEQCLRGHIRAELRAVSDVLLHESDDAAG